MSGQVHDVDSIVDFWPGSPLKRPGSEANYATDFVGVALVVVKRDTWVITTELRPVRLVGGRYVVDQVASEEAPANRVGAVVAEAERQAAVRRLTGTDYPTGDAE